MAAALSRRGTLLPCSADVLDYSLHSGIMRLVEGEPALEPIALANVEYSVVERIDVEIDIVPEPICYGGRKLPTPPREKRAMASPSKEEPPQKRRRSNCAD